MTSRLLTSRLLTSKRRRFLAWALFFGASAVLVSPLSSAEQDQEKRGPSLVESGFRETVWIVRELDGWIDVLEHAGGYEVKHRGDADPNLATYWSVDLAATGESIREVVMGNVGAESGFIRLLRFPGEPAPLNRPFARSWDSGGHFDVNMRVADIDRSMDRLEARGWNAYSAPVAFSFGPFKVREVLAQGPDAVVLALIQRLEPPLEGWPHLREWSRVFNATQIVADFDGSLGFFRDVLGFQIYLEHHGASSQVGPNVLGLPHDLTTEKARRIAILSPDGRNEGSVEILAFDGVQGADFSDRADPPHRGIVSLRFPVADVEEFRDSMTAKDVEIIAGPQELELKPWGRVKMLTIRAPEGAWLEFFEIVKP